MSEIVQEVQGVEREEILIQDTGWHTPDTQQTQYNRYIYSANFVITSMTQLKKYKKVNVYFYRKSSDDILLNIGSASIIPDDITESSFTAFYTCTDYDGSQDQYSFTITTAHQVHLITKKSTPVPLRMVIKGVLK